MEHLPNNASDPAAFKAYLLSDALVASLRQELATLYPECALSIAAVRQLLHNAAQRCDGTDSRWPLHALSEIRSADLHWKEHRVDAAPIETEETLGDILNYDRTRSVRGG